MSEEKRKISVVKTYNVKYTASTMTDRLVTLEDMVEDYIKRNPDMSVRQVEHLWGDTYGAKIAVVYEKPR